MKQLISALKAARTLEVFVLIAVLAALLALALGGSMNTDSGGEEGRMERILSDIEGAGRVRVMLSEDESGACTGAVVACSGADEMTVVLQIQRAVQTLTGLELDRIEIMKSGR